MAGPPNAVAPRRRKDRKILPKDGGLRGDGFMVIDMLEDYYGMIAMSKDQIIAEKCFQVRAP